MDVLVLWRGGGSALWDVVSGVPQERAGVGRAGWRRTVGFRRQSGWWLGGKNDGVERMYFLGLCVVKSV